MADAIDDLERSLEEAICNLDGDDVIYRVHQAIDSWRKTWGGDRTYISKRSQVRRDAEIAYMVGQGISKKDVAKKVGITTQQVRRITSKKSNYIE